MPGRGAPERPKKGGLDYSKYQSDLNLEGYDPVTTSTLRPEPAESPVEDGSTSPTPPPHVTDDDPDDDVFVLGERCADAYHRAVHEGGIRVCMDREQRVVFFTKKGAQMSAAPRFRGNVHLSPEPQETRIRRAGWDGSSRWKRDRQIPWATEARALAALEATE